MNCTDTSIIIKCANGVVRIPAQTFEYVISGQSFLMAHHLSGIGQDNAFSVTYVPAGLCLATYSRTELNDFEGDHTAAATQAINRLVLQHGGKHVAEKLCAAPNVFSEAL